MRFDFSISKAHIYIYSYVYTLKIKDTIKSNCNLDELREPTHQKWSNFAIFGFIVQFDPWGGARLWEEK